MKLSGHGITAELPPGWEGVVAASPPADVRPLEEPDRRPPRDLSVAHLATFPLPPRRGDFGSGAVEAMTGSDAFVALVEYGPESLGTALFTDAGLPRRLSAAAFSPRMLQRTLAGQVGSQQFFTEAGRPFCLYVVLGSARAAAALVARVNAVLAAIEVTPA